MPSPETQPDLWPDDEPSAPTAAESPPAEEPVLANTAPVPQGHSPEFNPSQLRAQADLALAHAQHARDCSEYPRYGESVYLELAAALRTLADTVEETAAAVAMPGLDRAARQTRRLAWLKRKAAYYRVQALRKSTESHDIASRRPFGQPILVGHHSERGHRRDLERQHRKDDQAAALRQEAKEAALAAAACASNQAIYSDDADAVAKLQKKVADLEGTRDLWKQLNAQYRKAKGNITAMPISDALKHTLARQKESWYMGAEKFRPADAYVFQNLGAEIRRCQKRIEELLARQNAPARAERRIGYILIRDNIELQKTEVHFPEKPSEDVRAKLHSWGFRWIRSAGCWSRGNNAATEERLEWLAALLGQSISPCGLH